MHFSRHGHSFMIWGTKKYKHYFMKKIYLMLSLLATTVVSAYAVTKPTVGYPEFYTGTSFKATWSDTGASKYLLSLYTLGDNMISYNATFADVNQTDGKLDTTNPNIPAGFDVDIATNGSKEVVYYNDRNHILLDASGDKVSTTLMVGGNMSNCKINANLVNAEGITKDNSSIFRISRYDKEGQLISYGEVEAYYFYLKEELDINEAFGYKAANVGKVVFEIVKQDGRSTGDIAINSIQYDYTEPKFVFQDKEVTNTFYMADELDAEKVYYYYVKAQDGTEVSDMSYIMYVDGFLNVNALPATNLTATSFTANWDYLPKALGYYLQPYRYDVEAETKVKTILAETFSKSTQGTMASPVSVDSPADDYTDNPGWTGAQMLGANGMLGANNGSRFALAYVHSPIMNLSAQGGKYKIHFKGHGTAGDNIAVYHYGKATSQADIHRTTIDADGNAEDTWEVSDGDSQTMLSFEENKMKKFFLEEVTITQEVKAGDVTTVTLDMIDVTDPKTTSYAFTGLDEGKKYGYTVTGKRNNDLGQEITSETSPVIYADLGEATGINNNAVAEGAQVSLSGNTVTVTLVQPMPVYLFTLDGCTRQMVNGKVGVNTLTLTAGQVYIVKVGGRAYKVMAK